MEVIIAILFLIVLFSFPVMTGLVAKSLGRKFWFWFFMGIALPLIGCIILLCLPVKRVAGNGDYLVH